MRKFLILFVLLLIPRGASAEEKSVPQKIGDSVKKGGEAAGRGIEKGGEAVGRTLKKGGEAIEKSAK